VLAVLKGPGILLRRLAKAQVLILAVKPQRTADCVVVGFPARAGSGTARSL
jgi:hypothetical protein